MTKPPAKPRRFPVRWTDRMAFRETEILLEDGRPLGEALDPWQREDFAALDDPRYQHAFLERPRGHSKTGDVGTEAVVELVLGKPGQRLYAVAADQDQAALLLADVREKFARNPRLAPLVKPGKTQLTMKHGGSTLTVLAADAPSAYGLRPDWICCDEVAEWKDRAMWDAMFTATGKRAHCRVLCISTAGWDKTGIAWEVRELAQREPDWYFSSRPQCASWIKPAWLAQQQRTLPPHVFKRLHQNLWVEGAGAFLTGEEVDAIFLPDLPQAPGVRVIGVDLGLTRDRTVIAGLRVDGATGLVCIDVLVTLEAPAGRKVDLRDVEAQVADLAQAWGAPIVVDPWQAALMAQRWRAAGLAVIEYSFTAETRRKLFGTLLDVIRTGQLRSRPHEALRRELLGLEIAETTTGWRVDHKPGRHDDHVVALALALGGFWSEQAVDVTALEQLSPAELRFAAEVERFWGRDPAAVLPGYVAPDWVDEESAPW